MPAGGTKDEHFSCSHSSCQWGLNKEINLLNWNFLITLSDLPTALKKPSHEIRISGLDTVDSGNSELGFVTNFVY